MDNAVNVVQSDLAEFDVFAISNDSGLEMISIEENKHEDGKFDFSLSMDLANYFTKASLFERLRAAKAIICNENYFLGLEGIDTGTMACIHEWIKARQAVGKK